MFLRTCFIFLYYFSRNNILKALSQSRSQNHNSSDTKSFMFFQLVLVAKGDSENGFKWQEKAKKQSYKQALALKQKNYSQKFVQTSFISVFIQLPCYKQDTTQGQFLRRVQLDWISELCHNKVKESSLPNYLPKCLEEGIVGYYQCEM